MILVAACGGDAGTSRSLAVSDSAGVTLIEFSPAALDSRVVDAGEPVMTLGVVNGDPAQEFNGVRTAIRLSDGSVVLGDAGSNEIRFFNADGTHAGTIGGTGDGPGEFQSLANIGRAGGDTVYAFDRWQQRVTFFDGNRQVVATQQLETGSAAVIARLGDGSFLPTGFLVGMPRRERGVRADTAAVAVHRLAQVPDTILHVITLEWFSHGGEGPPTPLPWGRRTVIGSDGQRIHVARTDRLEVRSYTSDGTLVRIVRSTESPPVLDDDAYTAIRESWLESAAAGPSGAGGAEARWADLPRPGHAPEVADLRAAPEDLVWVELYRADGSAPRSWIVMHDGMPVATVRVPASGRIIDVGPGHMVVRRTDELGVEFIDVHELPAPSR